MAEAVPRRSTSQVSEVQAQGLIEFADQVDRKATEHRPDPLEGDRADLFGPCLRVAVQARAISHEARRRSTSTMTPPALTLCSAGFGFSGRSQPAHHVVSPAIDVHVRLRADLCGHLVAERHRRVRRGRGTSGEQVIDNEVKKKLGRVVGLVHDSRSS